MAKPRPTTDAQKRKQAIRESALRGLSMLVVDDNPDTRAILGAWFEHRGCVAVTAESAAEAVFIYRLARPDIVVTDIFMPERDGHWLLRTLRSLDEGRQERTPVIGMSAYRASWDLPLAFSATFDGWISKPINLHELTALVQRITTKPDRRMMA